MKRNAVILFYLIRRTKLLRFSMKGRSSHPEEFCKKGVLRNFAKLTGKHLCQGLFFNKVAGRLQLY